MGILCFAQNKYSKMSIGTNNRYKLKLLSLNSVTPSAGKARWLDSQF